MTPQPGTSSVDLPVALTVAGSDSGGGAGIQADLKTFEARDVFGTSAITAVTSQNTTGVTASEPIDPETVREQIRAVVDDFPVGAIKTGMLATSDITETVAEAFAELRGRPDRNKRDGERLSLVVDPVMVAESGDPLLADDAIDILRERLVPRRRSSPRTSRKPNFSRAELSRTNPTQFTPPENSSTWVPTRRSSREATSTMTLWTSSLREIRARIRAT